MGALSPRGPICNRLLKTLLYLCKGYRSRNAGFLTAGKPGPPESAGELHGVQIFVRISARPPVTSNAVGSVYDWEATI